MGQPHLWYGSSFMPDLFRKWVCNLTDIVESVGCMDTPTDVTWISNSITQLLFWHLDSCNDESVNQFEWVVLESNRMTFNYINYHSISLSHTPKHVHAQHMAASQLKIPFPYQDSIVIIHATWQLALQIYAKSSLTKSHTMVRHSNLKEAFEHRPSVILIVVSHNQFWCHLQH